MYIRPSRETHKENVFSPTRNYRMHAEMFVNQEQRSIIIIIVK